MTLDLARPEHREALRWAATAPSGHCEHITPERYAALRVLSSPALSASLLRTLLERCGIRMLGPHEASSWPFVSLELWDDGLRYEVWEPPAQYAETAVCVPGATVPTLILALLNIPAEVPDKRERAMAALREHGR